MGVARTKYQARKSYERQSSRATFTQIGERKQMYRERERERCEYDFEDPDSAGFFFFLLGL